MSINIPVSTGRRIAQLEAENEALQAKLAKLTEAALDLVEAATQYPYVRRSTMVTHAIEAVRESLGGRTS